MQHYLIGIKCQVVLRTLKMNCKDVHLNTDDDGGGGNDYYHHHHHHHHHYLKATEMIMADLLSQFGRLLVSYNSYG